MAGIGNIVKSAVKGDTAGALQGGAQILTGEVIKNANDANNIIKRTFKKSKQNINDIPNNIDNIDTTKDNIPTSNDTGGTKKPLQLKEGTPEVIELPEKTSNKRLGLEF